MYICALYPTYTFYIALVYIYTETCWSLRPFLPPPPSPPPLSSTSSSSSSTSSPLLLCLSYREIECPRAVPGPPLYRHLPALNMCICDTCIKWKTFLDPDRANTVSHSKCIIFLSNTNSGMIIVVLECPAACQISYRRCIHNVIYDSTVYRDMSRKAWSLLISHFWLLWKHVQHICLKNNPLFMKSWIFNCFVPSGHWFHEQICWTGDADNFRGQIVYGALQ